MASGSSGSRRFSDEPMIPGPIYSCSYCHRTFTNLHARGGHMTMHRREVAESRREYEEYMSKRTKDDYMSKRAKDDFTMHLLPPNRAFWRRYHKGQEKLIGFPVLKYRFLSDGSGESSHDPMPSQSIVIRAKEKGGKLYTLNVDLTLKPWFA